MLHKRVESTHEKVVKTNPLLIAQSSSVVKNTSCSLSQAVIQESLDLSCNASAGKPRPQIRCAACVEPGVMDQMAVCQSCKDAWHLHCYSPALPTVPPASWVCYMHNSPLSSPTQLRASDQKWKETSATDEESKNDPVVKEHHKPKRKQPDEEADSHKLNKKQNTKDSTPTEETSSQYVVMVEDESPKKKQKKQKMPIDQEVVRSTLRQIAKLGKHFEMVNAERKQALQSNKPSS